MRINTVIMDNFRCWERIALGNLTKYNVLIGENSSGKSSILMGLFTAFGDINLTARDLIKRGELQSDIILGITFSELDVEEILSRLRRTGRGKDNEEKFFQSYSKWRGIGWKVVIEYNNNRILKPDENPDYLFALSEDSRDKLTNELNFTQNFAKEQFQGQGMQPHPARIHEIQGYSKELMNTIIKYVFEKQVIHIPARRKLEIENIGRQYSLPKVFTGSLLKRMLHDAKNSIEQKRIEGFQKFQEVVSGWSFSPGTPDISAVAGGKIDLIFRESDGTSILVEEVGDGVKEAVLIAGVCLTYPEKIFLIEEPELHLHPRALRELRELLKYEIEGQVFISTHSPTFINEMDEETTIIKAIRKEDKIDAVLISKKSDLLEFRQEYGLYNSDFLFEDSLVFVEGYSDKKAFESWFELLFPSNHSVRFLAVGGEHEIKSTLVLSLMLQLQQNFVLFSILDADKVTPEEKKEAIMKNLQGRIPQLIKELGYEEIKKNIYVLHKKKLESYFEVAPRVIADWLEINEKSVIDFLTSSRKTSDRKLKLLAKKHNIGFNNVRDLPKLASIMEKKEIDPEIRRLLTHIQSLIQINTL